MKRVKPARLVHYVPLQCSPLILRLFLSSFPLLPFLFLSPLLLGISPAGSLSCGVGPSCGGGKDCETMAILCVLYVLAGHWARLVYDLFPFLGVLGWEGFVTRSNWEIGVGG